MKQIKVKLSTVEDVKSFAELATKTQIKGDVYGISNSRHIVPADSILGIFSLNLNNVLIVLINDDEKDCDQFIMQCKNWIVD